MPGRHHPPLSRISSWITTRAWRSSNLPRGDRSTPPPIKSISLEGGVMRVYAQSEEEIFTVTLSVSPDPSSIMRKSQMIKRDPAFQLPYRSTPVSSSLICRSLARLIGVDSKMVATVSKGPSSSPFLPVLPEPASTPPVAIPEAISTSPKPPEPASASADPLLPMSFLLICRSCLSL